ncbi:hypothetical protein [Vibrio campbellii]|uniref:hypothetical protein n=1 Tax=Vibrio campbellii TaxID=680 RepID=UPI004056B4FB
MQKEKHAIYCFSLEKTKFAPIKYDRDSEQTLEETFLLGAWIHQIESEKGALPTQFSNPPFSFKPKILSYYDFREIGKENRVNNIEDNILVILMPSFDCEDLKLLEMVLGQRYDEYIRKNNIVVKPESEEILELKPNVSGFGVNLKALWKKLIS